jgi:hypothetical protein
MRWQDWVRLPHAMKPPPSSLNQSSWITRNADIPFFLATFAICYYSFFPGILGIDGTYQLGNSLVHLRDWHSPLMCWIWSGLNRIYVGPALMLLVIQLGILGGLYLILRLTVPGAWTRCIGLLFLLLYPMNFPILGYAIKDSFFAAAMLLGIGFTALASLRELPRIRRACFTFLAFGFLYLALATRPDGLAAILPLIVWLVWIWFDQARRSDTLKKSLTCVQQGFLAVLFSLFLCVTSYLSIGIVNTLLCEGIRDYPEQRNFDGDLAGISIAANQMLFPPSLLADGTTLANVKSTATPADSWALSFAPNAPVPLIHANHQRDYDALRSAWLQAIRQHPLLYLRYRLAVFTAFLGLNGPLTESHIDRLSYAPDTFGNFPSYEAVHAVFVPGHLIRWQLRLHEWAEPTPILRPILYVLLVIGCACYFLRWPGTDPVRRQTGLILALSGLSHTILLFILLPGGILRYAHWLALSATLSTLLVITDLWAKRRPRPTTAP